MYNLQPEKKSRGWISVLAIVGALALAFAGVVFALLVSPIPSTSVSSSPARSHNEVEYKIRFDTGISNPRMTPCGKFSVTYAMPNGTAQKDMEACKGVSIVDSLRAKRGDHLYLSIQNTWPNNNYARYSCIISIDGTIVAQVESIGTPNIASCSTSMR